MNLDNTTESLYDLLKEYVGKQMEEERRGEEFRKSNQEGTANFFLNVLKVVVLIITAFLLHYLWLYWKSGRTGPVTRIPKVIINQKYLKEEKYTKNPDWKCLIEYSGDDRNMCTGKVDDILRMVFSLPKLKRIYYHWNAKIVTIKMNGFEFGQKCHEFEPVDGVIPGSHFTYQMFGDDTIQVTRYVVGSKSYVAGFCIYIKSDWVYDVEINMNVVKKLMEEPKYPGKEAVEKELKEELEKMKESVPSKFTFWQWIQKSWTETEQNEVPPSYSSLSIA